jgi:hypothetical protein
MQTFVEILQTDQFVNIKLFLTSYSLGPGVAYWLRHCATNWRVSGSIPSRVAGDFSVATEGTMCPGVDTASKNEYRNIHGGKEGRCERLTTYHLYSAERHENPKS